MQYEQKGRITDYAKYIRKVINNYSEFKFATFLGNIIYLAASEKSENSNPSSPRSPLSRKGTMIGQEPIIKPRSTMSEANSPERIDTDDDYKILATGSFQDKIFNYLHIELLKRDSFFFEMVKAFAEEFSERYKASVEKYYKLLQDGPKFTEQEQRENSDYKSQELDALYERGMEDAREFQNFLCDCLLAFVKQISRSTLNCDDLLPSRDKDKRIERLATRVLFTKNSLYEVLFKLIRIKHWDHEKKLKNAFAILRDNSLTDFKASSSFCLTNEDSPYQRAIDCINYLDTFTNPYDKYDTVFRVRREIYHSVDQYWSNKGSQENKNRLILSADQLVPVFCYCLAQSENYKMKAHQVFIEAFVHQHLLKYGEEAYYFTTFTASLDFLITTAEKTQARPKDNTN